MSASGHIVLNSKNDVLTIPNYYVEKVGEQNIVKILGDDARTTDRVVELGILGSDSQVEDTIK